MDYRKNIDGVEYWLNAKGALVSVDQIKEIDRLRDDVVREVVSKVTDLSAQLKAVKQSVYETIDAFIAMSAEQYGVVQATAKGNVSLLTYDGRYKVQVAIADVLAFDERLQTAKSLIDECLVRWSDGASHNLAVVVREAFRVDKKQQVDVHRILELRRYDIHDERWQQAMQAISDSITVQSTRRYIRIYARVSDDQWQQIPLDWSCV